MFKILKREVETKERLFSIGTSSEFEPEKRDRNYTTSAFLNREKMPVLQLKQPSSFEVFEGNQYDCKETVTVSTT